MQWVRNLIAVARVAVEEVQFGSLAQRSGLKDPTLLPLKKKNRTCYLEEIIALYFSVCHLDIY